MQPQVQVSSQETGAMNLYMYSQEEPPCVLSVGFQIGKYIGMRTSALLLVFFFLSTISVFAQKPKDTIWRIYPIRDTVIGLDDYHSLMYYHDGRRVFDLKNSVLGRAQGEILSLKVSPDGNTFAILEKQKQGTCVNLYDLRHSKHLLHAFQFIANPVAVAYTPSGKELLIATPLGCWFFDASTYGLLKNLDVEFPTREMMVSPDSAFVAFRGDTCVEIWSLETGMLQDRLCYGSRVSDMDFSFDSRTFSVLTTDGILYTYMVPDFLLSRTYEDLGLARACAFHPDGKYVAVVSQDDRIAVLNMVDYLDRQSIVDMDGGISDVRFVRDPASPEGLGAKWYIVYNTALSIKYQKTDILKPYYTKLLAGELKSRMDDWLQQMPGESLEDYRLRITDENREKQMRLFEEEIATRMADDLSLMPEVRLGNYNPETNLLGLSLERMPAIYLSVPVEELQSFVNQDNLEFRNVKYGISKNDMFELVYADVYNKETGKTYVFDNRERKVLDFLETENAYIPIELALQSNMEELQLQEIRTDIMNLAKQRNMISDHTDIKVSSRFLSRTDSLGNKSMDYVIDFSYTVEESYSVREDFGPGRYHVAQSGAAQSMLAIIQEAFEGEFAVYVKPGKMLLVNITGMADALPIRGRIAYDGVYGDFDQEAVFVNGEPARLSVNVKSGITNNEQLAFLRAYGFKDYISNHIPAFGEMDTDYRYFIEVNTGKGGQYRRVKVQLVFPDVF